MIVGDVGTGKTKLMAELLEEAIALGFSRRISVLDCAPSIKPPDVSVGSPLESFSEAVKSVRRLPLKKIYAPRLMARSAEEALELATGNKGSIDRALEEFLRSPTKILFVNDISLYFQVGGFSKLEDVFFAVETFVATGYFGERLAEDHGSGISRHERTMMERLMDRMNVVIRLPRDLETGQGAVEVEEPSKEGDCEVS